MERVMQEIKEQRDSRFAAVMDHIAVKSEDLERDVAEYERMGFRLETLYHDWAMLRDARGFGIALLGRGSKHPPHLGLRVESREDLERAAAREGRPVHEHRDRSVSFYTKGVGGNAVEVIYYPPDYTGEKQG
ncbi:MAG: glyoxalase [Acidobacteria bacterium]|nr:MAG: glyoxalase [Acidobacteriota bacterium]